MPGFSDYTAGNVLAYITGKTVMPSLPTAYVALFTVAPTSDAGTGGTEVSGGAYARVTTAGSNWNVPSASSGTEPAVTPASTSNSGTLTFTTATASWGTVVYWALYDALANGNYLCGDYLGNYSWLPATMTLASPGVVSSPAHGYSNGQAVVVTTKYGGSLPSLSQGSFSGTLLVANATTDTFTLTTSGATALNSSSSGDFQVRAIVAQQSIPTGVQASFAGGAPGALVLTSACNRPNPLVNLCQIATATTGTGTITLGSAVSGYRGTSALTDGTTYSYSIIDGTNYELGQGLYTASGTALARGAVQSSNSNAAISLSGNAVVFVGDALSWDIGPQLNLYIAGRYYFTTSSRMAESNSTSLSGVIRWVPFVVTQPITLASLGAVIGVADSGGNIGVALYAGNATPGVPGLPAGPPLASTSGISTSSTGAFAGAITTPGAGTYSIKTPGLYWLGVNADNATVRVSVVQTDSSAPGAIIGAASAASLTNSAATQFNGPFFTTTQTYGTWPTNPTVTENAQGAVANTPVGFFQVTSVP